MAKPIAIQLYTVRDALAQDWEGTLERIAEAGFLGVETAGFGYAPSTEAAVAKFQALGLEVVGAHAPLPMGEKAEGVLAAMEATGCKRLICAGTGREQFGTLADVQERAATFNEANAIAKANGLSFGLHNHWWEYTKIGDRYAYDVMMDTLDDDVFFEIDTYWVQVGGLNAVEYVSRMADRAPLLHIKDGPVNIEGNMVAVGSGEMDIAGVINAGTSAEWLVVELDRCGTDMMTAVIDSAKYLTSNGLGKGRN